MTSDERRMRRFSEEFRREQVRLIELGERTIMEVSRLYEVKDSNVRKWVQKFGNKVLPEMRIIQTQDEVNRVKDLEKQISHLKGVIGQLHVEMLYKNELLALAKEQLGFDFEKKIKP